MFVFQLIADLWASETHRRDCGISEVKLSFWWIQHTSTDMVLDLGLIIDINNIGWVRDERIWFLCGLFTYNFLLFWHLARNLRSFCLILESCSHSLLTCLDKTVPHMIQFHLQACTTLPYPEYSRESNIPCKWASHEQRGSLNRVGFRIKSGLRIWHSPGTGRFPSIPWSHWWPILWT